MRPAGHAHEKTRRKSSKKRRKVAGIGAFRRVKAPFRCARSRRPVDRKAPSCQTLRSCTPGASSRQRTRQLAIERHFLDFGFRFSVVIGPWSVADFAPALAGRCPSLSGRCPLQKRRIVGQPQPTAKRATDQGQRTTDKGAQAPIIESPWMETARSARQIPHEVHRAKEGSSAGRPIGG